MNGCYTLVNDWPMLHVTGLSKSNRPVRMMVWEKVTYSYCGRCMSKAGITRQVTEVIEVRQPGSSARGMRHNVR